MSGLNPNLNLNRPETTSAMTNPSIATAAAATAATTTNTTSTTPPVTSTTAPSPMASSSSPPKYTPTDQAVLEYLKSKGMGSAVLELQSKLKQEPRSRSTMTSTSKRKRDDETATSTAELQQQSLSTKERLELEEDQARNHRMALTKATGGSFGYDRDAAAPILQWGVPDTEPPPKTTEMGGEATYVGVQEARAYLDAFCALQLWVLTLPDDSIGNATYKSIASNDVIAKAQRLIQQGHDDPTQKVALATFVQEIASSTETTISSVRAKDVSAEDISQSNDQIKEDDKMETEDKKPDETSPADDGENEGEMKPEAESEAATDAEKDKTSDVPKAADGAEGTSNSKSNIEENVRASAAAASKRLAIKEEHTATETAAGEATASTEPVHIARGPNFNIPPSAKPELLTVTFALLVHTYCELLEVGMETTAHVLRDAFTPLYEPIYGEALKDLHKCSTTEGAIRLNTHNSQHMEALAGLKSILVQIASLQLRQEEVSQAKLTDPQQQEAQRAKLQEYNQTIGILQQKHNELAQRASQSFEKMHDLPFLRRARAVRWHLNLSTASYALLAQFFHNSALQSSLLSMSTLLQTKCELHIERRDPLPYTPAIVLDDNVDKKHPKLNESVPVNWAAPVPGDGFRREIMNGGERPFPKYNLDKEYEDERSARRGKRGVEFNRALLIHGFRRLEALERKGTYDMMYPGESSNSTMSGSSKVAPANLNKPIPAISKGVFAETERKVHHLTNPLKPTILLSTLCANAGKSSKYRASKRSSFTPSSAFGYTPSNRRPTMSANLWDEAGVGLVCAKLCPPDGRRVAVGCDDAAVRIWDLSKSQRNMNRSKEDIREVGQVLLGHKNGFPVFDVSWNKDGCSLLSAGGDGSIRLWDTMLQGSFGDVTKEATAPTSTSVTKKVSDKVLTNATAREALTKATDALHRANKKPSMDVPGVKGDKAPYRSGAALAVYRGHAPRTPIWSVAFSPSGYYFASAGGDATARLWTTDRTTPVRMFAGHTSNSVHSVAFHPNCNYIITGSEDRTARLWDIQTGRCVRLLNGCAGGIHQVQIDPSGQYATGADSKGSVYLWDLGTGKKVTEFKSSQQTTKHSYTSPSQKLGMVHSMAFSACGKALATGGDDQCVRIWDVEAALRTKQPVVEFAAKSYRTRRTLLLDLEFTKRNLLLSVGKLIATVPINDPITSS